MVAGLGERERLREALGAFVDPAFTERVLAEGTDLRGEEIDVSVLFLDVRDFTASAESAAAHEVVAALNSLYEAVVPVILRHGGHVDKFTGDGRRDFTVIGDPVNTAARVEAATRLTGDDVLITDTTLRALGRRGEDFEERPSAPLKGKAATVRLYAPRSDSEPRAHTRSCSRPRVPRLASMAGKPVIPSSGARLRIASRLCSMVVSRPAPATLDAQPWPPSRPHGPARSPARAL
jgi:class 3 adenylate cyclase